MQHGNRTMTTEEIFEASHHDWGFSTKVFIYSPTPPCEPIKINFHPVATELYEWLLRKGDVTHLMKGVTNVVEDIYENPFTHDATTLACLTAQVINDSHANYHKESTRGLDQLGVELKRVRIYNELVISSARTCEAVIKQLLHCTQFFKKDYDRVALGGLLFKECRSCKKDDGRASHNISLLGSLAHRYPPMCRAFDCVLGDLQKLNQERTRIAAHSSAPEIFKFSYNESMARHNKDTKELLYKLVHILDHLSALETLILEELNCALKSSDISEALNISKYHTNTTFKYFDKWGI